jgi:transcriptional regulator with XRE-family HTH domain
MSFVGMQQGLRKELRKRIEAGELTGMELARRTNFTQAHISNFLNGKRGLKLSALDRMCKALGLNVYDLLDPREVAKHAAVPGLKEAGEEEFVDVPLVEGKIAAGSEVIVSEEVKELLKFRKAFLKRIHAEGEGTGRGAWTRFVLIKVDPREGMSMWPRIGPGSTLLVDRHYNGLRPYRKGERNMYAVRKDDGCTVKYVEVDEKNGLLVLRPQNPEYPVEVQRIEEGKTFAELIVGRVAHVAMEV